MQYFPIFVDGQQLSVLVVGGGEVATRKVELMLKTPADITVISPAISSSIEKFSQQDLLTHIDGYYDKNLLKGKQLVFVATENRELNAQITKDAREMGVLANVVDDPSLCHFITPSIVDRSPMIFAISSEGQSPVLVRYWRERLETILPQAMGAIATFAGSKRQEIKKVLNSVTKRRNFWELFFSSSNAEQPEKLRQWYEQLITQVDGNQPVVGELYVVQAPQIPDGLSLAGLRHMQKADIAIYQKDVARSVVELVRRDAEREQATEDVTQQISQHLANGQRVCYITGNSQFNNVKQSTNTTYNSALFFNSVM